MYHPHADPAHSSPTQIHLQPSVPEPPKIIKLTSREIQALQWSAKGKSSWEISRIFNCTEAGVNYHFSNIRRKFGVSSRSCAVLKALEQGLIQLS